MQVKHTGSLLTLTWPSENLKEYRLWKFTLKTDPLLIGKSLDLAILHTHALKNTQNFLINSLTIIVQSLKLWEVKCLWKVLRNLILSHSSCCFEQKFGLTNSWGPFWPELSHVNLVSKDHSPCGWLMLNSMALLRIPKWKKLFSPNSNQLVTLGWSCVNTGLLFTLLSGLLLCHRESKLQEEG